MTATVANPSNFSGDTDWTYDDKDRLLNETSDRFTDWDHDNAFDGANNPTTFKNNSRSYNSNNQLTTGSMTYDGNGNPTTYAGGTLTFDVENRITSINGTQLANGYRADGLRAWKEAPTGGKTYFLYDGGSPGSIEIGARVGDPIWVLLPRPSTRPREAMGLAPSPNSLP